MGWNKQHFEPGRRIFERVEKAKRFRDASPLERIEIEISAWLTRKQHDTISPADVTARIEQLEKQRAELRAQDAKA